MARISRRKAKNEPVTPTPGAAPEKKKLQTAIYGRLSIQDLGIADGDTMETQVALLRDFVLQQPDLELAEAYVDNGWTGTNFNRPEFVRMMEDVKNGKIGCIVVKDLSRLGRNYLESGYYLQNVFPAYRIRFIAIYDGYDSATSDPEAMLVGMKNIINDYYSKDLSRKLSASIDVRRSNGPPSMGIPPFGYIKDPKDKSHFLIDREAAPIIHLIFKWALDGMEFTEISRSLNDMRIPTPGEFRQLQKKKLPLIQQDSRWTYSTVTKILRNRVYAGDMVSNKTYCRKYDPQNTRIVPEEEWIIYPDTHDAYITHEEYDFIRGRLKDKAEKARSIRSHSLMNSANYKDTFKGLVFCGNCRRYMSRQIDPKSGVLKKYICNGIPNRMHIGHQPLQIDAGKLQNIVLISLQKQLALAIEIDSFLKRLSMEDAQKKLKAKRQAELQMLYSKQAAIQHRRQKAFEDLSDGLLDKETYQMQIKKLDQETGWLEGDVARAKKRVDAVETYFTPDNKWLRIFLSANISPDLDSRAVHLLIKQVEVWHRDEIQITFYFSDWMQQLESCIREYKTIEQPTTPEREDDADG